MGQGSAIIIFCDSESLNADINVTDCFHNINVVLVDARGNHNRYKFNRSEKGAYCVQ